MKLYEFDKDFACARRYARSKQTPFITYIV